MRPEHAGASDRIDVAAAAGLRDHARVSTSIRVRRWDADQAGWAMRRSPRLRPGAEPAPGDFARLGVRPYSVTEDHDCNQVVQAGWVALLGGIAGTTMATKFSAAAARIGAGTGTTTAGYSQTALAGDTGGSSTTSYYKLVSTAPVITTSSTPPTLVLTAVFGASVANFAWQEFGTDNGTADGVTTSGIFFNRGLSSQGTKASGQIWTITETMSFGVPSGAGTLS